jgi:hypothetical protein
MTAKESLRDLIDNLTEEEARSLVVQGEFAVSQRRKRDAPKGTLLEFHERIRALFADIPDEEWEGLHSAADIDKVLYADLERGFPRANRG